MTLEIIKQGEKEKLGKELINFKKLKISHHASIQFYTRTGYDLENTSSQLKSRLSEAKLITNHPYEQIKNHLYLQDPFDRDIIYVVKSDKKRKKDVLVTVRKSLKKSPF